MRYAAKVGEYCDSMLRSARVPTSKVASGRQAEPLSVTEQAGEVTHTAASALATSARRDEDGGGSPFSDDKRAAFVVAGAATPFTFICFHRTGRLCKLFTRPISLP